MSALLVADYQRRLAELQQYGGSANEDSIRKAFARLLDDLARPHDLRLIEELEFVTSKGAKVYPDGTLKDALRLAHGYWEAKDEYDDLDQEIQNKRDKGYPTDNILFEDSRSAVLIQNGREVGRVSLGGAAGPIAELLRASKWTRRPRSPAFRPALGSTSSGTAARWNGCSTSTRKANRATRPSLSISTPTASPTTKEQVIALLAQVCTVSVETQAIVQAMRDTAA